MFRTAKPTFKSLHCEQRNNFKYVWPILNNMHELIKAFTSNLKYDSRSILKNLVCK